MARNKRALVTGCTSGIGEALVLALAKQNYDLILLGRDEQKLSTLKMTLEKLATRKIVVDYFVCDFELLSQVASVSKLISHAYSSLDVLVNNAGIWETKHRTDGKGREITWVVNYFASYILTNNLLPLLKATAKETNDVRIISISSDAHKFGKIRFPLATRYTLFSTYGSTKLANVLHSFYLATKLREDGITVNAIHPGVVASSFWRSFPKFITTFVTKRMISTEEGAKTALKLCTVESLKDSGKYWEKEKIVASSQLSTDTALQERLYAETTKELAEYLI